MFSHILGIIVFTFGFIGTMITDNSGLAIFGVSIMCLLWIMGIEQDIYANEKEKPKNA